MEYQKITNLLDNIPGRVRRLITKKWIKVHDQSGESYSTKKQIRFKASMLRTDLRDYNQAYVDVKGNITVERDNNKDKKTGIWHLRSMHHLLVAYQR